MKSAAVYCDESGNSGSNYLDPQQPLYVLAGWWVDFDVQDKAERAFSAFLNSLPSNTGEEIRGSGLLRNRKGQTLALDLFRQLGQLGCIPLFVLAEKRYCLAAKMVETFLDPVYNPAVSIGFTADADGKQDIAEILCELPDKVVGDFALAYRSLDAGLLRRYLEVICIHLSLRLHPELADSMMRAMPHMDDLVRQEQASGEGVPGHGYRTLNMPVFASFACICESIGRLVSSAQITLIHDESKEFEATYDWVMKTFVNARRVDVTLPNDRLIPLGFEHVRHFKALQSSASSMIQAAHVLATFLRHYGTKVHRHQPVQDGLVGIAQIILPGMLIKPQAGMPIASRRFMASLFASVSAEAKP